jgi:glyoxalase family protein
MENNRILGLHHVTALSSDAVKNVDFYAGILGLRMVKKTVNFDAPDVYHLYYGDREGAPGTLMTFFPYKGMARGRKGAGQLTVTAFSIPAGSLDYWMKRLDRFGIGYSGPRKRFENEEYIYLEDFDGLGIELVMSDSDYREGYTYGHIPRKHTIKGFYGITISESEPGRTGGFLSRLLDHKLITEENGRSRFSPDGEVGGLADVVIGTSEPAGRQGSGTVHHVAFATAGDETQLEIRERLVSEGVHVTPVIDRQYFKSVYFREPGGVLFEVATLPPGMAIDEDPENLGSSLMLPPWHEKNRAEIESNLEPVELDAGKFSD